VNVHGVVHGIQAFVPRMIASGEEGLVLNTSSGDGGIQPLATQSVYASSKAAISILTECLDAQLAAETRLRAAIFYPAGGMLATGLWTTKRNRPAELVRERPVPDGSETTFDEFMRDMKAVGIDLPVQDLDALARHAVDGIKAGDFVIMIGREAMEVQLGERARRLAAGENPTGVVPGL
jgi:NAD(P)-dependent dehydrogenase (short-subunit alcohol dehydrogenase family)